MLKLKRVGLRRGQKLLLDQASLTLPEHCVCGIIGRNGAGKSSLFALLQGQIIDQPTFADLFGRSDSRAVTRGMRQYQREAAIAAKKAQQAQEEQIAALQAQETAEKERAFQENTHSQDRADFAKLADNEKQRQHESLINDKKMALQEKMSRFKQ